MDPIEVYARRDMTTFPFLRYSSNFVWLQDATDSLMEPQNEVRGYSKVNEYADSQLEKMFVSLKAEAYTREEDYIVRERANELIKIKDYVEGNADLVVLRHIFNFEGAVRVSKESRLSTLLEKKFVELPQNFVIALPNDFDVNMLHFVYFFSKMYLKITMLQLTCSSDRYLICMHYAPTLKLEDVHKLSHQDSVRKVGMIFQSIPDVFASWFAYMNNSHLGSRCEFLIREIESKSSYDNDWSFYWSGVSYDFRRVVNYLNDRPTQHTIIKPRTLKLSDRDEKFMYGLHLFATPENLTGTPLHRVIDMENDKQLKYRSTREAQKGGIHWGQRKLLDSELDFIISNTEAEDITFAIYVGAAPFNHGPFLLEKFPNLRLWLCDPRNVWDPEIARLGADLDSNVLIKTEYFTDQMAEELSEFFRGTKKSSNKKLNRMLEGVNKVLFFSDIRRFSPDCVGQVDNESCIDEDMNMQSAWSVLVSNEMPQHIQFMASLKFRLPYIMEIGGEDYEYLGGVLHTQPFSRMTSAELRLWWKPENGTKRWSKEALENIMMYHNYVYRSASYGKPHEFTDHCECHDCNYEIQILLEYVKKFSANANNPTIWNMTAKALADQINVVLKKTLTAKTNIIRTTKTFFPAMLCEDGVHIKYNAPLEDALSTEVFRLKTDLSAFLAKLPSLKDLKESSLKNVVNDFLIYNAFVFQCAITQTNLDSIRVVTDIIEDALNVKLTAEEVRKLALELSKQFAAANKTSDRLSKELQLLAKEAPRLTVSEVKYSDPFTTKKLSVERYKITLATEDQKTSSTMAIPKDMFKRFLMKAERIFEIPNKEIRENGIVNSRAYCLLKRYGCIWSDHFALIPESLFDEYDALPGTLQGASIFSAIEVGSRNQKVSAYDETYMSAFYDLEGGFTIYKNNLNPSGRNNLIFPPETATVFFPPIKPLYELSIARWFEILRKYSNIDQNKIVAFLIPTRFKSLLEKLQIYWKHEVIDIDVGFTNTMTQESNIKLKDPLSLCVYGTTTAEFTT